MKKWYDFLLKNGMSIAVVLSTLAVCIFGLGIYLVSSSSPITMSELANVPDKSGFSHFNAGLIVLILFLVVAVILLFGGMIWDVFRNFKTGYRTLYIIGAMFVGFVILYFLSSHDSNGRFDQYWAPQFKISKSASKLISSGMWIVGGMLLTAFVSIIYYETRAQFKKS
jgi:MFS family permease